MDEQTTNQQNYRDDEIDLRKLFQAIGRFFINIGNSIIYGIIGIKRATIRYRILLIALLIIGIAAGVVLNRISKPYYQTSMLITSDYFNSRLIENAIDKLNLLCGEEERIGLAVVLGLDTTVVKNIRAFEYEPFVTEQDIVEVEVLQQKLEELKVKDPDISRVIHQIEIQNKKSYEITVQVFDTEIIDNLEQALVSYFRDNPYILNRIKVTKKNREYLIAKLERDVTRLDSLAEAFNLNLQSMATRPNEASNNVYVGEGGLLDPTSVYSQGVSLYSQLLNARKHLELGSDFEVIDGFTVFSKPESAGLKKSALLGLGMLLGLGYLLIIILEINKYLNKVERKRYSTSDK